MTTSPVYYDGSPMPQVEPYIDPRDKLMDELVVALEGLSNAVIEYGRTDVGDAAEAEWDAVLAADKAARAALAKVKA